MSAFPVAIQLEWAELGGWLIAARGCSPADLYRAHMLAMRVLALEAVS